MPSLRTNADSVTGSQRTGNLPTLAIVVPCYNEEDAFGYLLEAIAKIGAELLASRRILRPLDLILVDDGSTDSTWDRICEASKSYRVTGVRLARNTGHQNALLAGLMRADADMVVSMDADLQDDPRAILEMVGAYQAGAEIVFGVRRSRETDTWFKRRSALAYYRFLKWLGVDLVPDHADFRLMSRKAIAALGEFGETNLFLRGIVCQVGLQTKTVVYDRARRSAGESKYPLHKMLALAIEGITSFSVRPLRLITWMGFGIAGVSLSLIVYSVLGWMFGGAVPGWTSTVVPIYLLGGAHLVALGVIGEYVGKIYQETKRRPRYQIDEIVHPKVAVAPNISVVANG